MKEPVTTGSAARVDREDLMAQIHLAAHTEIRIVFTPPEEKGSPWGQYQRNDILRNVLDQRRVIARQYLGAKDDVGRERLAELFEILNNNIRLIIGV